MKVLLSTVGGSDRPIVTSIKKNEPDYVIFFCSAPTINRPGSCTMIDGEGKVCKDTETGKHRESIVKQTNLTKNEYSIVPVDTDDPYDTYEKALQFIEKFVEEGYEVIVDYTGGTVSMVAGLGAAGIEHPECKLNVVTGMRQDLMRVKDGMERIKRIPVNKAFIRRGLNVWKENFSKSNYTAALQTLDQLQQYGFVDEHEDELNKYYYLTKGFQAWDRFDYRGAAQYFDPYKHDPHISVYNEMVKKLANYEEFIKKWSPDNKKNPPGPGFLLVYDVIYNAMRKGRRGLYDDATARFYRAIEMYAQFSLMTSKERMLSSDIKLDKIPENYHDDYSKFKDNKGRIKLGLVDTYELLDILGHPISATWKEWKNRILNIIEIRNKSFLAHGFDPVDEHSYKLVEDTALQFIRECDESLGFSQGIDTYKDFPSAIDL